MIQGIKPLNQYSQSPASEQIMRILFAMTVQRDLGEQIYADIEQQGLFHFKVGVQRAEGLGIKLEKEVMVAATVLSNGPGAIILYLHAIYHWQLRLAERGEDRSVNIGDFCEMFATGFPDDETMSKAWDAQKDAEWQNNIDRVDHFKAVYSDPQL